MKKFIIILVAINFLFVCSASAFAAGGLPFSKVRMVAFQTGGFFLYSDSWSNPNSCTKNNAIVLLNSDLNYDKAYALLLAAYMSGKKISGYSDGCAAFDGQTYNTIRGFKYLRVSE